LQNLSESVISWVALNIVNNMSLLICWPYMSWHITASVILENFINIKWILFARVINLFSRPY